MTDPRTPDNVVIIDAGTLTFSDEDLTATGLLLPYGVPARSNLGTFTFSAGDIAIPEDLAGMSLNEEHRREAVVGMFTKVWEQPETGLFSAFKFANTVAGRLAYANAKSGKRKNLSAEVANVRIQGGKALPGAVLFAGAVVEKPAFEGATLLAAADTTKPVGEIPEELAIAATEDAVTHTPDLFGAFLDSLTDEARASLIERLAPPAPTVAPVIDEDDPTIQRSDNAAPTTSATPAEDTITTEPKELIMTASAVVAEPVVAGAQVPATLLASAPITTSAREEDIDLGTVFAAMANLKAGVQIEESETLLAALSDITTTGAGALAGAGVLQPAWVGKLWQGRRYTRKYLDLFNHTYGGIQLGGRKGFKLAQGTALVAKRGAEKTELPSGSATTSAFGSTRDSYGLAVDVAREWSDLEGGAEVLQAFWEGVVDSYAKVTDEDALRAAYQVASRTAAALDRLVAPIGLPAGTPANSLYYPAVAQLIQAIEAISDAEDEPGWAVVNPIAWQQLLYTPKELLPEFVSLAVTAGSGEAKVDGKVVVKKAPQSFFVGTTATAPQVMAGAKNAIEFREQGQTPIRIDAANIAKHGVDSAIVGYLEAFIVRPESTVLIGTKP